MPLTPSEAQRLWILLVVAYVWMLFIGKALVENGKTTALKKHKDGSKRRQWSLFREGRQAFLAYHPTYPFIPPLESTVAPLAQKLEEGEQNGG